MEPHTYSVAGRTGRRVTVAVADGSLRVDVDGFIASVTRTGRAAEHSDAPLGTCDPATLSVIVDGAEVTLHRRGRWNPRRRARGVSAKIDTVEYVFAPRTKSESVLYRHRVKLIASTSDEHRVRISESSEGSATQIECALAVALAASIGCGEPALLSVLWRGALELFPFWP